jgi:hypothetical protein
MCGISCGKSTMKMEAAQSYALIFTYKITWRLIAETTGLSLYFLSGDSQDRFPQEITRKEQRHVSISALLRFMLGGTNIDPYHK